MASESIIESEVGEMDKEQCSQAGIDYDAGLNRFMGHQDIYEKYLLLFLKDESYRQLEAAMKKGDIKEAFAAGHSMKGVVGNLSMNDLYQAVIPFVDALRGEGDMAKAKKLYPAVKKEYKRVTAFLKTIEQ